MKTTTISLLLCLCCFFGNTQSAWYPWVSEGWDWESEPAVPQTEMAQWWWWWQNALMQPVNQVPPKPTTTPKPSTCSFTTAKPEPCMKQCQYGSYVDSCNQCRCAQEWELMPVASQSPSAEWWWWWWLQNAQMQPVNQVPPKPATTPKPPVTACQMAAPEPKPCMGPCQYGSYMDGCNQCMCAKNPVDININNNK